MKTIAIRATDLGYPNAMRRLGAIVRSFALEPPTLYIRGELPSEPGIAVVGTRKASAPARRLTAALVEVVAAAGCSVWSGGALGVDAVAHRSALAAKAATVVVTAGGLDSCYPAEHTRLYKRVLDRGGALVSLQADGQPRRRHHFLERNAVLAALSRATLMTQAPLRSGARSTCSAARRLGRPLWVVPAAPWDKKGAGGADELARGAQAVCTARQLQKILSALLAGTLSGSARAQAELPWRDSPAAGPATRSVPAGTTRPPEPPTGDGAVVLQALAGPPLHVDELTRRAGLSYARLSAALLELRLRALVVEVAPGHYGLA